MKELLLKEATSFWRNPSILLVFKGLIAEVFHTHRGSIPKFIPEMRKKKKKNPSNSSELLGF